MTAYLTNTVYVPDVAEFPVFTPTLVTRIQQTVYNLNATTATALNGVTGTGLLSARPTAGTGPGGAGGGAFYYATDVALLYYDTGTAWVALSPSSQTVPYQESWITSDVALTTANTFYTVTSLAVTPGTYYCSGQVAASNTINPQVMFTAKLGNGVTPFSQAQNVTSVSNRTETMSLSGVVTFANAGTVYLSVACEVVGGIVEESPTLNGVPGRTSGLTLLKIT